MAGIVDRIVHPVSALPESTQASYQNSGISYDYAIGGLPFLSAASNQYALQRKTADYLKQQIDQTTEPGEQTLVNWWLRSQSSFHAGTGIVFEEPNANDPNIQYRFQDSAGVDVWTAGKVTLLKQAPLDKSATAPIVMGAVTPNGDAYFYADGNVLTRVLSNGTTTTVTWGGSGTILSLTNDGTNYYAADATGIYSGPLNLGSSGTLKWNTGSSPVVIKWVKSRLMAAIGSSIYELAGAGPALPTATFTHPNSSWVWASISESPEAIYAAGYAGSDGAIFMFVLDTSGLVPSLTSGILAAQLPEGEQVYSIYGYLGSYLAIGTNKGVRIADVQQDGTVEYGPLSVVLASGAGPVRGMVGQDRFIYGTYPNGIAGNSGLWRIDLGTTIGLKLFAWANDLQSHVTGNMSSLCLLGASGRLVMAVDGHGTYVQSATDLEPTGYLTTGNIRYHMLDQKLFKYVRVWAKPLTAGSVSITSLDHAANETTLVTFTAGHVDDPLDEVSFPAAYGPQQYVALKIGLSRSGTDATAGPTVTGYQVKTLPAQKRQRTFVVPLLCYDKEADASGAQFGNEGSALTRLRALETLEEVGDIVRFDDLTRNGGPPRQVIIDGLVFIQTAPPKLNNAAASGWGGVIMATLRAVS